MIPSLLKTDGTKCDIKDCEHVAMNELLEINVDEKLDSRVTVPICHLHLNYFIRGGNFALCMAITEGRFESIPKDYLNAK
jgi:hypothetical protein